MGAITFAGMKSTVIHPRPHSLDNFGPRVQAVTFTFGGKVHTINRRGKSNVKVFYSFKHGTVTVTNGTDRVQGKGLLNFDFVSVTYTNGHVQSSEFVSL